jgi:predicted ATP-grasp superfamily ATP-dependent carboligase
MVDVTVRPSIAENSGNADVVVGFPREVSGFSIHRSLSRNGRKIGMYDSDRNSAGLYLKGLEFSRVFPDPVSDEIGFIEALLERGNSKNPPVLIDLESAAVDVIARYQDEIRKRYRLVLPSREILDIALDKAQTVQFFRDYDLSVPKTMEVNDASTLSQWGNCYPAVFKPRRGKGGRGQVVVNSFSDALDFLNKAEITREEYILQEWIPGPVSNLFNCGLVCAPGGKVRAAYSGQRLGVTQSSSVLEGVSSYARSIRVQELIDIASTVAKETGWEGMAEFEFKKDDRDGRYKLLEINPRFWASIQLPVSCGIDFPKLYYTIARHGDCQQVHQFEENIYYYRCILHLYTQTYKFRNGDIGLRQLIRETVRPYLNKLMGYEKIVLEDIKLSREYFRWFLFYFKETVKS